MAQVHENSDSVPARHNGSNGHSGNGHMGHSPKDGSDTFQETMLHEYMAILMRGKWMVLGVIVLVMGVTAAFTWLTKPVYEASAKVLVDAKAKTGSLPFLDLTGGSSSQKINNELETLTSRVIAEGVVRALTSRAYVDDAKTQRIQIIADKHPEDHPDRVAPMETVLLRLSKAVEFVPVRESDVLRITAQSTDPREAALLANTFMQVYTERNISSSRVKSKAIREFLQAQLGAKHDQLDTNEAALQTYMKRSGVVSLDDEAKKLVTQLAQLEADRDAIEVDISSRQSTLTSLKQELSAQEPNVARAIGESNDAYIKLLQEQLAKLEVQRDVAIAQSPQGMGTTPQDRVYGDKMSEINEQINTLKKNLRERTTAFLGSLVPSDRSTNSAAEGTAGFLAQVKQRIIESQIELDGLKAKKTALNAVLKDYEHQFNQIPEKSIDLAKLQRARLSSEKLFLLVEEKFNEAAISETSELGYLNVIDPAAVPLEPVSPRPLQNMLLALLTGVFLAITVVITRARLDDRIRAPEDLKRRGLTMLATVARIDTKNTNESAERGVRSTFTEGLSPLLVSIHDPFSPTAEAYRHLRTNVQFALPDLAVKSVMVTSPSPKEGKSTTASNLAISFAQTERKVLLVDADLRRPSLQTVFGLCKEPGLTNYVLGQAPLDHVLNGGLVENLDILTCGLLPPNPAEILGSRRMKEFIEQMTEQYDIIIFDTPPMLAVTDGAILARQVDGVVLVASSGKTTFGEMLRAGESLAGVEDRILGIILNNFDLSEAYGGYYSKKRYGYRYGYGYGYRDAGNSGQSTEKVGTN